MLTADAAARWQAARPFAALGAGAIIAGGLVAAAVAHHPAEHPVWMSAYLVLVVGVAQIVFGVGQAWLSGDVPGPRWSAAEWIVFNLGNLGVIIGTLCEQFALVLVGTVLFALAIALFLLATRARGGSRRGWLMAYRIVLGLVFASSLVGLALAVAGHMR
ncbi:MAG: hypothetical protein KGK35_01820 [Xanthomonadaceae bacterium]|nr:hypothetical protein [Xanthomonadaceae bacterium]